MPLGSILLQAQIPIDLHLPPRVQVAVRIVIPGFTDQVQHQVLEHKTRLQEPIRERRLPKVAGAAAVLTTEPPLVAVRQAVLREVLLLAVLTTGLQVRPVAVLHPEVVQAGLQEVQEAALAEGNYIKNRHHENTQDITCSGRAVPGRQS